MRILLSRGSVLLAGLLVTNTVTSPYQQDARPGAPPAGSAESRYQGDPRLHRLRSFFERRDCPLRDLSEDFIAAADRHGLDWRLLPSISFVESSGGKDYVNNNVFGWDSARHAFPSVRAGIHIVAGRLANSKLYKGKSLDKILHTYNPRPHYRRLVKSVMRRIGPADPHPIVSSD